MSYIDDLLSEGHIPSNLADNYRKGLNGAYANRLRKGIEVASQATAEELSEIIKILIDDRKLKSKIPKTKRGKNANPITTNDIASLSDDRKRALILALWSSRIPTLSNGRISLIDEAVYGDSNTILPVNLPTIHSTPDSTPISKPKRLYDLNEEKVKKVIEAIAGLRDDDNVPVKDVIDFIKSDADKMGVSLSSNFENEVRQIIKKIMKK
jgi:hypothetical protein